MDVVEYLDQVKYLHELIVQQTITVEELKASNQKLTALINDMPRAGLKKDLSDIVARIDEEMAELKRLHDLRLKIIGEINSIMWIELRLVLYSYYVNRVSIEDIADNMKISYATAWKLKKKAEQYFFEKYKKNNNFI